MTLGALLVAVLASSQPADPADPAELLSKVAAIYRDAKGYHVTVEVRRVSDSPDAGVAIGPISGGRKLTLYATGIGNFRYDSDAFEKIEHYYDGRTAWAYHRRSNQYTETIADPQEIDRVRVSHIERFEELSDSNLRASLEKTTKCGKSQCAVIKISRESEAWSEVFTIDLRTYLVMKTERNDYRAGRHVTNLLTMSYTYHSFGEELDAAVFRFEPKKGAKRVDRLFSGPSFPIEAPTAPRQD